MSSRPSTEPERPGEGGWQDWPPSAEIVPQTLPINVIVGGLASPALAKPLGIFPQLSAIRRVPDDHRKMKGSIVMPANR